MCHKRDGVDNFKKILEVYKWASTLAFYNFCVWTREDIILFQYSCFYNIIGRFIDLLCDFSFVLETKKKKTTGRIYFPKHECCSIFVILVHVIYLNVQNI